MGIEIGLNNIKTTRNIQGDNIDIELVDLQTTNIVEPEPICIEISGLKTINKFIGLEDTPLYYENGKFFKVLDNKIIYTDINWEDIKGDITQNPELSQQVLLLVEENAKKYTKDIVNESIETHNTNPDAHQFIQSDINNKYTELTSKINDTNLKIDNTNLNVESNTKSIQDLNTHVNNVEAKADVNTASISDLNQELISTNEKVDKNITDISNLNQQIVDNYNDLNQLINNNSEAIVRNTESIQTNIENITTNSQNIEANTKLINDTIENLKEYSKTNEFANVAFSGSYTDLLNIPDDLATTQYVDQRVNDAIGTITGFDFLVVDQLPDKGEAGHIYLVPHQQGDKNIYDEYIWVQDSNNFELIGTTEIDLSNYYTKEESDSYYGAKLVYNNSLLTLQTKDNKELTSVTIKSTPDVDDTTIHLNNSEQLEVMGNITKDGTTKYDWIGTKEEYEQGLTSGLITSTTICYITDDKEQLVIKPDLNIPTKLSELANDSGFITNNTIATTTNLGLVKPDGNTITIDNNGVISIIIPDEYVTEDFIKSQGYLTELPDSVQLKEDQGLTTSNKTTTGAINELKTETEAIQTQIGDISTALDSILGEVI